MRLPKNASYGWRGCNIAIHDTEIQKYIDESLKKVTDPWQTIDGNKPSVHVWRVQKLRATPFPIELFGQFYQEEVFLVLSITEIQSKIYRNIHIWIGKNASELDYRVGCQLVNKLDKRLNGQSVIHRDVQGFESEQFKSIFNPITYWNGTFEDSFWMSCVKDTAYQARMLKMYKPNMHKDFFVVKEVAPKVEELDPGYTFILDTGKMFYLWHGNLTPTEEDLKCTQFIEKMKANRGCQTQVEALDDDTEIDSHEFFTYLARGRADGDDESRGSTLHRESTLTAKRKAKQDMYELYKIKSSDKRVSGLSIGYAKVKTGKATMKEISKNPLSFYCTSSHVFIIMNKKLTKEESDIALQYGHDFVKDGNLPYRGITIVRYKQSNPMLNQHLIKQ